ncbi:ninein [Bufo gargarizans]|uniref:ninein n=1 Tax=Bufo gargarizans TaxID=30331 RepID=UPI001CF3CE41|nr:ninein [Bufo gargarizans]
MEQDQYEARLKELFDSFDTTGTGSLGQEELTDLCHMLQLEEVAPSLQQVLLQDNPHGRIHFDQFKEALIDALSSTLSSKEICPEPDGSPEAQPKYIKDGKRYGRRSVPELQDSLEEYDEETVIEPEDEGTRSSQVSSRNCEELWRNEGEEYEAEGQLRFWNPDDLSASQTVLSPDQDWVEEKLQLICEDLGINRDGHLNRKKLLSICEQYGFQNLDHEALEDALQNLDQDDTISLQDFFYEASKNSKPPTPSSSTPYRQLKRHLSLQPYDETGRRTLTPSAMTGTIGLRLFSKLDDGTGYSTVEDIIDLWHEEGLENGPAILKALDFCLEGKINLMELTMALENELLITKNEVYQAALVSFRSEIRHLLERADQTVREKEKLRADLEKNEKLKSLMASEVDDHHAAIEHRNEYNLRKLDEEYKERTTALKTELRKEREQLLQQANHQRLELEQELDKLKLEENYLRDRLTLSIKENSRMENELLETSEKLADCEVLTAKLQKTLDNILREKFGDLDPSCVEFFRHEEKLMQVRNEYERQRRELQDRIDELQLELEDYRAQGIRGLRSPLKTSLFDEMDNKNAVDYDQGIGSEDCPPLNMSIEAEMAIEQMREQHQREMEQLQVDLESKVAHYEEKLKEAKSMFEKEQYALKQKLNEELHKAEEQIQVYKIKHLELEANISRLIEAQQKSEHEHRNQMDKMGAEFSNQRVQLMEQEAVLQFQLEEAKETYHKEKEELVQRAEELEKKTESKIVDVVSTYEEKKSELEQSFNEKMLTFQEKHDLEKLELQKQLLEQHELEVQAERKKIETEYNRRISENEARFVNDYGLAVKKYEKDLVALKEKFEDDLQDLRDQHAEEKAQWAFEKEELLQESVELQERLKEQLAKIENEKQISYSEISLQKELLEKTYKELVNNLQSEKFQLQNELEKLKIAAKQVEVALKDKILQLENDLLEELTERDEQLLQAQTNINNLVLQETIQKVESHHATERETLNEKLLESEALYKEMCDGTDTKRQEMLVEITRLQSTINELQNEISSLSKIQMQYTAMKKENEDLKKLVSDLQNSSILLEEERSILKKFQQVHEQIVKENVQLLSEIAKLQKLEATKTDAEKINEEDEPNTEELGHKDVQHLRETIEQLARAHKSEKDQLNSKLLQSEKLYREMCDKSQKDIKQIASLQDTIKDLEKEMAALCKTQGDFKVVEKQNEELKCLVEQLQNRMVVPEDEKDVFKSLQAVHEKTVKENVRLLSEISRLQKKLLWLDGKSNRCTKNEAAEIVTNSFMELEGEDCPIVLDPLSFSQYKETIDNVNFKLQNKTKELEDLTKVFCRVEQSHDEVKTENGHLKTQIIVLQEKLSGLALEYDQVKKAINLEVIPLPEPKDAPISIPGLKLLLAVARKENLQLKESMTVLELKNIDAIENNKTLSSEVSWLQKEIQNMEEITEASLKLEQLYEEAKKENHDLKALVHVMQEKIYSLEKIHLNVPKKHNNDLKTEVSLEPNLNTAEHSPCSMTFSMPHHQSEVENVHILQLGLNSSAGQEHTYPEELPKSKKLQYNKEIGKPEVSSTKLFSHDAALDHRSLVGGLQEMSPRPKHLIVDHETQKRLEHLRCENKNLKEENALLVSQINSLKEDVEANDQKHAELIDTCEDMWVNLETTRKERLAMEKKVNDLTSEVTELKSRNEQLAVANEELFSKNSKNQEDIQDLNLRMMLLLKQRDRKDSGKDPQKWKEEIEGYKTKVADAERELSKVKAHNQHLEEDNTLLKQDVETKKLSKSSEVTELRNEISLITRKNEKLMKEKEALGEELNRCVAKVLQVGILENKIASLKQEQKTWEQQSLSLKSQVAASQEQIQSLEENLQSVNLQMARLKSDLRVAQQEKESLKQEVMSLHKQLQNANAKKQVLEMAVHSSGLQNQQKKQYWDDLEQLMEQEQQLLRQENDRLQREVQLTKGDLAQTREKVRQLESAIISLKHQKQQSQSSLVKALEQEKSSLKRECDQLQTELLSANRKISQLSAIERELETIKAENEVLRAKQGKFDDPFMEMRHPSSGVTHSRSPLQQQACATSPREQYLQLQVDRRNQQHQATADNLGSGNSSPQGEPELLLRKMEGRMVEVEQKLRIVKMLLQEKVTQLKEQVTRNTRADAKIKDLYVENSQLLKALEMSAQRHQTAEKKNYFLEEKISGLSKIVRDLTPAGLGGALTNTVEILNKTETKTPTLQDVCLSVSSRQRIKAWGLEMGKKKNFETAPPNFMAVSSIAGVQR